MPRSLSWRWVAVSVFALSSTVNYLDRQILAALAPQLMREFHMTEADYGDVIMIFSICYMIASPLAGLAIDRLGLNVGASFAVGLWSMAGMATGFVGSLRGLIVCRSALGIFEAAGIPGTGKASALYLEPKDRAYGSAISQVGLTIGAVAAPVVAQTLAHMYGWRTAFVAVGAIGLLWIPAWLYVSRRAPRVGEETQKRPSARPMEVLRDVRYWALLASNVLLMSVYSLWVNWTTIFFVRQFGMSQQDANYGFAWVPPIFATAGGMFGGWLVKRWAADAEDITAARMKAILLGCVLVLSTAAAPFMPTPILAALIVCASYFFCVVASVNIYSMPLDLFGAGRAAFAISGLTGVFGLVQVVISPAIGRVVQSHGFAPVCIVVAILPIGSWLVLHWALRRKP